MSSLPTPVTAAIAGIGIDLLRVDRIRAALERHGDRFATKILGQAELAVFHARRARDPGRGLRYIATRFAAKEAFSKAIGLGMRMPMTWTRVQVLNAPGGRPALVIAEPLKSWFEERFGAAHVSLTDETDMAAAYVVVEAHRVEAHRVQAHLVPTHAAATPSVAAPAVPTYPSE